MVALTESATLNSPAAGGTPATGDPHRLSVEHVTGDRFTIRIRDHVVHVDQPRESGGYDSAPTPTELFAGALASCVAFYARRYLARHRLPEAGLRVTASYTMAKRPARVGQISVRLAVSDVLTGEQRRALLAVASHCTVHNTLEQRPLVTVQLDDAAAAVA